METLTPSLPPRAISISGNKSLVILETVTVHLPIDSGLLKYLTKTDGLASSGTADFIRYLDHSEQQTYNVLNSVPGMVPNTFNVLNTLNC